MDDTLVDRALTLQRWADRHQRWPMHPVGRWLTRRLHVHRFVSRMAALYERTEPRSYCLEEGVAEALARVRRQGWRIAVITNGNRRTQPAKLASAQIEPLVDAVVISSHESFAKPDPRVFRLAARRAGTSLEEAWVIGDDLRQEIAGAARLGLRSVWLNPHGRRPNDDVDLEARSFPEAVDLVLSLAAGDAPPRAPSPPGRERPRPPT
jgi:putative hydrolase of the HAD superfamily